VAASAASCVQRKLRLARLACRTDPIRAREPFFVHALTVYQGRETRAR